MVVEQLHHIVKRFTIIDLLGMAVPGAMVVVTWNFYFGGITVPVESLFGESGIALALYFIAISYLAGMMIQEASKPLEKFMSSGVKLVNEKWQNNSVVMQLYSDKFWIKDPKRGKRDRVEEIGRNVFLYVSDSNTDGSKLDLFHAFYSMARNSIAAMIVIVLLWGFSRFTCSKGFIKEYAVLIWGICFILAMWFRACRFSALTQERAYRDFLKTSQNSKQE